MNDRVAELVEQFKRYLREASIEWKESFTGSPEAHAYTLALGAILASVVRWVL